MQFHIHENPNTSPAYQSHIEIRDEENQVVAIINGGNEMSEANARLIAAAPEMFSALEHAAFHLERLGYQEDEPGMKNIRAAIAKAKGE